MSEPSVEDAGTVLDASAVLALLQAEPGASAVADAVPRAAWSSINASEVVAKLAERGMGIGEIKTVLGMLALDTHPFDAADAVEAGLLRPATKAWGLSLGDRACLALGRRLDRPVLTADRAWRDLDLGVEVRVIR